MCVKPDTGDSATPESELNGGKFLIALECLLSFETSWIAPFLNNQLVSQTYGVTFKPLVKEMSTDHLEKVRRTECDFSMSQMEHKQFKIN